MVPALRAFGHEVWPVPTVILSNHPGHGGTAGFTVDAGDLRAMIGQLADHGWLGACDAVLTGYFRDVRQCAVAAEMIHRLRSARPNLLYCCDPVLGDDPGGLYVGEEIAEAVRDFLIPLCDVAVPNRFELEWLTGCSVNDQNQAAEAARKLGPADVVVTSVSSPDDRLATVWATREDAWVATVDPLDSVPHGIGDLTTALVLARVLADDRPAPALGTVTAQGRHVLMASRGRNELDLVSGLAGVEAVTPVETVRLEP